ncbi:hypothetical protein PGB90_009716 [Kerria lacca]
MLRLENSKLKEEIENLRNELNKQNLIIHGVPERESNLDELEKEIQVIIEQGVGVELPKEKIDYIRRVGQKSKKPRPVLLRLMTLKTRMEILNNKKNLKEYGVYIQEDLTYETRGKEKMSIPLMKEKRAEGKHALVRWGKLYVDGSRYYQESEERERETDSTSQKGKTKEGEGESNREKKRTMEERSSDVGKDKKADELQIKKMAKTDIKSTPLRQATIDQYKKGKH